jgi:hypothetical protein
MLGLLLRRRRFAAQALLTIGPAPLSLPLLVSVEARC